MKHQFPRTCGGAAAVFVAVMVMSTNAQQPHDHQSTPKASDQQMERLRDRLWIWGHPAGVYNDSYLAALGRKSTIEPVAAADWMGIRNMIFVRYQGKPQPPFETYYRPFEKLDRVYWSLVGAGGATSEGERRQLAAVEQLSRTLPAGRPGR
jgi:hypothetical protein